MAEITAIETILYGDKEKYLSRLFDFFNSPTVNYFRGGLAGKILTTLLLGNPKETLEYIKTRENFLILFTNHINIPSIMDFFLRFITLEEGYAEVSKEYLVENNFANILFHKFSPEYSRLYSDITLFITELIVAIGTDSSLFEQFIQKENIELLFSYILDETNSTSTVHGLNVIITFVYILSDDSMESHLRDLSELVISKLGRFNEILLPNNTPPDRLGFGRLKIIELYESLLQVNYSNIVERQEIKLFLESIVKLFFHFEQHSILHKTFYRIISVILDKPIHVLIDEILKVIRLHHQIMEYFNTSIEKESNNNPRTSCIAHCVMIGKHLLERCETNEELHNYLSNDEEWKNFVVSKLNQVIEEYNKPLGEKHPVITADYYDDAEDDYDDDERDNDEEAKDEFYDNSSDSEQSEESEEEIDEEDLELKDDEDFSCDTDYKDYDTTRSEVS